MTLAVINALIVHGVDVMLKSKELITAHRLAEELNLSVDTIWRYTREKKIPFIELGNKQYRYNLEQVMSALAVSKAVENDKVDFDSYSKIPWEPGYRIEVLDGEIVKDPSPNVNHQRIILRLAEILKEYFYSIDPEGEILVAPLDVKLDFYTVVQPDLFYLTGNQKALVEKSHIDGAPHLIVEVLSPHNNSKDRLQKLQLYQMAGVDHYWIIDPEDKTAECYQLKDNVYSLVASGMDDVQLEHPAFKGLKLNLRNIWPDR